MEILHFDIAAPVPAGGTRAMALVGVVASGNLEVLVERGDAASGKALVDEARALAQKLVFKLE